MLAEVKKHGDFSAVGGAWIAEGRYIKGDQPGDVKFEVAEGKGDADPFVNLKLNIDYKLAPLKQTDTSLQREPIGSGGLMMALYHYHRLLSQRGSRGRVCPRRLRTVLYPADGTPPKSLAALRVDCEVLKTRHATTDCKWYFSRKDHTLLGFETYITKDGDPCEVYFFDYKEIEGRKLPHKIEVRYGDKRYAILTINKYTLSKTN